MSVFGSSLRFSIVSQIQMTRAFSPFNVSLNVNVQLDFLKKNMYHTQGGQSSIEVFFFLSGLHVSRSPFEYYLLQTVPNTGRS
ncbi:unnamed protein product [Phytomonas sp. EM1]|nr:unnamed protein product [Phytomonas sp. EM1]|eukprot:CCW61372.1 unnamed protein product [Phytomonas sp. isolate EM1]